MDEGVSAGIGIHNNLNGSNVQFCRPHAAKSAYFSTFRCNCEDASIKVGLIADDDITPTNSWQYYQHDCSFQYTKNNVK